METTLPPNRCVEVSLYDLYDVTVPYKVVQHNYSYQTQQVVRTDCYPLLWVYYWFYFRLADSWVLTSAYLSHLLCIWFNIQFNPADRQRVNDTLRKLYQLK